MAIIFIAQSGEQNRRAMETYDEMVQYARDCMRHARTASSKEVAEELLRVGREYEVKAAKLGGGKLPNIQR